VRGRALVSWPLLCVQYKRARGVPLFDLDTAVRRLLLRRHEFRLLPPMANAAAATAAPRFPARPAVPVVTTKAARTTRDGSLPRDLDRYSQHRAAAAATAATAATTTTTTTPPLLQSYRARLLGRDTDDPWRHNLVHVAQGTVLSPHTFRRLRPFLWRDAYDEPGRHLPPKLALLRALARPPGPLRPLDYTYLRHEHLAQVNELLCEFFWPGIDSTQPLPRPAPPWPPYWSTHCGHLRPQWPRPWTTPTFRWWRAMGGVWLRAPL
jgi:hypothetical protein